MGGTGGAKSPADGGATRTSPLARRLHSGALLSQPERRRMPSSSNPSQPEMKLPVVIAAASVGTIIEWYDFYLYGSLAVFFSTLFFPPGHPTASLLASLATFGAGFAVRPFGAIVFGRVGDLIGRKYAFLVTLTIMGLSTTLVALLPDRKSV